VSESSICPRCSAEVLPDQAFCGKCGLPLATAAAEATSAAAEATSAASEATSAAAEAGSGQGRTRPASGSAGKGKGRGRVRPVQPAAEEVAAVNPAAVPETPVVAPAPVAPAMPSRPEPEFDPLGRTLHRTPAGSVVPSAATAAVDPRIAALGLAPATAGGSGATGPAAVSSEAATRPLVSSPTEPVWPRADLSRHVEVEIDEPEPEAPAGPAVRIAGSYVPPEAPTGRVAGSYVPPEAPTGRVAGGYAPPQSSPEVSPWALRPSSTGSTGRPAGSSVGTSVGAQPVARLPERPAPTPSAPVRPIPGSGPFGALPQMPLAPDPAASPLAAALAPAAPSGAQALEPDPAPAGAALPDQVQADSPTPLPAPVPNATQVGPRPIATLPLAASAATAVAPPEAHSGRKESVQELLAFGLIAGGAVIGMACLFLPWGNSLDGAGVGIDAAHAGPNQWGWSMNVALPLFLLSGLMLGAAFGSDRAKERMPRLASVVGQVTDMIMPMVLGGLYLGVVLMAITYPWGFGVGPLAMLLGGCLLIGGAAVTLFWPPEPSDPR